MATLTVTKTEQIKSDSSFVAIKSNTSENTNTKQNTRIKNKNAVLRKSKLAQNAENLDKLTKSQMNDEPHEIKMQLSRPEFDGEDSAIGSEVSSVIRMSVEDDPLLNENEDLLNDLDNLIIQPAGSTSKQLPSHTLGTLSAQPPFIVPKFPVPQTRAVRTENSTPQKGKFQRNRIQPVDKVPESAFQTESLDVSNNRETSDVQIDGEQSLNTKLPPSYGTEASSLPPCSRGGMSDIVILHTDADMEKAFDYMAHLLQDVGIKDLTVDLLSSINVGKPGMQSLATLHENYRHILTYVTDNLVSNKYCRFLQEIILTFGLKEGNGKEDRVVPVFTKNERCKILELSILPGLQYFKFHSRNTFISDSYLNTVRKLVHVGRENFP
ncbi:uncharacterized protein LOC123559714 [Mercenaria mercenaria]|uniref:uncharacterized protein LOC123559714 n=1 Tax=Mercenaria mercenaria TaxID=6596 RepID=UPI00234F676D|nr:uncharacterized protein LOC123559714 [Mercenaria mercenaria]XP_053408403.1 uncharacterized protein LOC123559714 [Mercenaria mercenaria]XP_053408404.1 uncharacterized protein LOC123559714 [Mercenaria mercenaria]XP_053408405.1 uncharacterized protein LOC123559714 [Mercenaria mercenaria]XP_053408406.1 uncharacterized protein LOC123559714 [Mercenaria mercenaria]XP_053408407.1 uncharacterized protein LOC123559714 [Mercenaria mercenaria]